MTSYNDYHKKHHERKKHAGYKKITFELNSEESIISQQVKSQLDSNGTPKTNKTLYMEAIHQNKKMID